MKVVFNFFSGNPFDVAMLIKKLGSLGNFQMEMKAEQTVVGVLNDTKVSFLGYDYPLLEKPVVMRGIQVASIPDIACMKIDAIASRGAKRDFIDLFFIARALSLRESMQLFKRKYAAIHYNLMHIKKSLVFFEDAEIDPMPDMLETVTWNEVKIFFRAEVQKLI